MVECGGLCVAGLGGVADHMRFGEVVLGEEWFVRMGLSGVGFD